MEDIEADSDRPWRPASSGPSFVYVLPCFGEDLAKIGMSRDPLDRFQTLHLRWFEFFDVDGKGTRGDDGRHGGRWGGPEAEGALWCVRMHGLPCARRRRR